MRYPPEARNPKQQHDKFRLALGLCVLITTLLFISIATNLSVDSWLSLMDVEVSNWLHARAIPALTAVLLVVTEIHRPLGIIIMALLCALLLLWRRRWYSLLILLLAVPGGLLINLLLKDIYQRARPVFDDPLAIVHSYSFPSGHAVGSTVFYGVIAVFIFQTAGNRPWRFGGFLFAGLMIILVAFTRVYLGVHYLSDVVAGILEGLAWLALCLIFVNTIWRYRHPYSN